MPNDYDIPDIPEFPGEDEGDQVNLPEVTEPEIMAPIEAYGELQPVGPTPEEEVQEEEILVNNIYDLIPIGIDQRRHLQMTYTSVHKGTTKTYVVEPYEVKEGLVYVWDTAADTIKSFYLSEISDIQLLDTTFIPRFT